LPHSHGLGALDCDEALISADVVFMFQRGEGQFVGGGVAFKPAYTLFDGPTEAGADLVAFEFIGRYLSSRSGASA
jgi:hypothetical protein